MAKLNQQAKLEQFVLGSIIWGGYSDLIDMVTSEDFTSDGGRRSSDCYRTGTVRANRPMTTS